MKLPETFWAKVDKAAPDGCWLWTGYVEGGYGRYGHGAERLVHRLVYIELVGPIPEGLELDHTCRVRACCNPDHLEPVTHAENVRRGEGLAAQQARQTECKRGHPFTPENTYTYRQGRSRRCRTCRREGHYG